MNIKKSNLFARYYNWIYQSYPKDLCSFFWGSVAAILLFAIAIPGRLTFWLGGSSAFINGILVYVVYLLLFISGLPGYQLYLGVDDIKVEHLEALGPWVFVVLPLFGLAFWISILLAFVIIVLPFAWYREADSSPKHWKVSQNTRDFIGAIRGKYCVKINWK